MIRFIENLERRLRSIGIHHRLIFLKGSSRPFDDSHRSGVFRLQLVAQEASHQELKRLKNEIVNAILDEGFSRMLTQKTTDPFKGTAVEWARHRQKGEIDPVHLLTDAEARHFMTKNPWYEKVHFPKDAKHTLAVLVARGHLMVSKDGYHVELPQRRPPEAEKLDPKKLEMLDLLIERNAQLEEALTLKAKRAGASNDPVNRGVIIDSLLRTLRRGASSERKRPSENVLDIMSNPLDFLTLTYPDLKALGTSQRVLGTAEMTLDLSTHHRTNQEMREIENRIKKFKEN